MIRLYKCYFNNFYVVKEINGDELGYYRNIDGRYDLEEHRLENDFFKENEFGEYKEISIEQLPWEVREELTSTEKYLIYNKK